MRSILWVRFLTAALALSIVAVLIIVDKTTWLSVATLFTLAVMMGLEAAREWMRHL